MRRNGWDDSAQAWIDRMDTGEDWLREEVLDHALLHQLGDLNGVRVLDMGCGEGRLSRMLASRGAQVTGTDYTPQLAARAWERSRRSPVCVADGCALPLRSETFEVVVTCLVLLDIPRFEQAVSEVFRVLQPGGRYIDAHLLPFRTASDTPWVKDSEGNRLHVPVEDYSDTHELVLDWAGIRIVNYHRSLATYLRPFLQAGFVLKSFEEPVPKGVRTRESDRKVPLAMVTEWHKPR